MKTNKHLTYQEVIKFLESEAEKQDFKYKQLFGKAEFNPSSGRYESLSVPKLVTKVLGKITKIHEERSDEEDHDTCFQVIKFDNCPDYFMGWGRYSSWEGETYEGCSSIIPVELKAVMVEKWVPKS